MPRDLPPAHHYVPVHCIPRTLTLSRADGEACAYACPAPLIAQGRWFRQRFADDQDLPVFYEQRDDGGFWLALRTLTDEPDARLDLVEREGYDMAISARFLLPRAVRRKNREDLVSAHQAQRAVLAEVHPSPGQRSAWGLFVTHTQQDCERS